MGYKPLKYYWDNDLPTKLYFEQFDKPKLEIGRVYRQKGEVYWKDYKIVFIGEGVALGVEVANGNNNYKVGSKELFYTDSVRSGFKYGDDNPRNRLTNKE